MHKLAKIASGFGDVVVGAPDAPQSGKSSALTVNGALELIAHPSEDGVRMFSITGTPVDCVKVAMHAILDRKPDLILSGINHGSNAAVNNIYSGTMGAAMEGCIIGIPSVGFSLLDHSPEADFEPLAPFVADIIRRVLAEGLPKDICLNVNFPAGCTPEGVKWCVPPAGTGRRNTVITRRHMAGRSIGSQASFTMMSPVILTRMNTGLQETMAQWCLSVLTRLPPTR